LRKHVSIEEARCGGLVLGRRGVVGFHWKDVVWWGCVWTCCGGVVFGKACCSEVGGGELQGGWWFVVRGLRWGFTLELH
jgi:hypothetical protein